MKNFMTFDERLFVNKCALSEKTSKEDRARLRDLYRNNVYKHCNETPEMRWLSEVDNDCPCYILKRTYREELLKAGYIGD